jgi:inosine/xanthosine triphosphatase
MSDVLATLRLVAVGSMNPVKIDAVRRVLARTVSQAQVKGIAVGSGVSDQPWGDDETIRGARARARAAQMELDADWGIGIEGGVVAGDRDVVRTCAWAAIAARDGREGIGGSLSLELPRDVAELVRAGMELGHAMDAVTGQRDVKHGLGAVGILTNGLVTRQAAYETLVAYAMVPLLSGNA